MSIHQDISYKLACAGIPLTAQRLLIACELFYTPVHLSAEDILNRVKRLTPDISRATVYNTLKLFSQKGLIRELIVDADRVIYDSNTLPHHHFYNTDTGELTDIDDLVGLPAHLPLPPQGTELQQVDIIVRVRNARH